MTFAGLAGAQQQTTTGPRSPIVNAPNGQVTLNYTEVHKLIRTLEELANADSAKIEKLMAKGDFAGANAVLKQSTRRLKAISGEIAFQNYAGGVLQMVQGRTVAAFESFAGALALEPDNCQYRALAATTSIYLDRLAEVRRIAGEHSPEAKRCIAEANFIDGARILIAQARLAIEERDESAAKRLVESFESSMDLPSQSMSETELLDAVSLNCQMYALQKEVWIHALDVLVSFRSSVRCRDLGENIRDRDMNIGRLVSFDAFQSAPDPDAGFSRTIEELTQQLELVQKSPEIGRLGFDQNIRSAIVGRIYLARGFYKLWGQNDPAGASDDYGKSFDLLQPIASPSRPAALNTYADLVTKIAHFESLTPGRQIRPDLNSQVMQVVARVLSDRPYDATPDSCVAIQEFSGMANGTFKGVPAKEQQLIEERVRSCVAKGMTPGSLRSNVALAQSHANSANRMAMSGELAGADESLTSAIAIHDSARGFPQFGERSIWLRAWLTQRAAIRTKLDRKDDARRDFEAVVELMSGEPASLERSQALGYLAAHIAAYYDEPQLAGTLADAAFEGHFESWQASETGCAGLMLLLKAGEFAASTWLFAYERDKAAIGLRFLAGWDLADIGDCKSIADDGNGMKALQVMTVSLIVIDARQAVDLLGLDHGWSVDDEYKAGIQRVKDMLSSASPEDQEHARKILPLTMLARRFIERQRTDASK